MNLQETLKGKIGAATVRQICSLCGSDSDDTVKSELLSLTDAPDDRTSYNALWVLTHLPAKDMVWLQSKRDRLIDMVLSIAHEGKRRLLLVLLERQPVGIESVRGDYLDFCLTLINSTESCSVRTLCLKQAFAQCRFYPELVAELKNEIEMMEYGELSPGLNAARRNIRKKIARL